MSDWQRVASTTIKDYIKGETVNILRNRKLLAMLKQRGKITMNAFGTEMQWQVAARRATVNGYADGDTLSFGRLNRWKTATLGWRGYSATDSFTKMEELQNKGMAQIINLVAGIAQRLKADIQDRFSEELYLDGNAAGRGKFIHGFESFGGNSGAASAGYIGVPSDQYANLQTGLGYYGGSWAVNGSSQVTWPIGTGDELYDFWSPLIIDYTNTSWAGATNTWAANCQKAVRFAITHAGRNLSLDNTMDMMMFDPELFRQFIDAASSKENLFVRRGEKVGLVSLGFTDVINYDGVEITREYGVPVGNGYGIPIGDVELHSLQGDLFVADGPEKSITTRATLFSVDFLGNLKCNPRNFTFFKKIS